MLAGMFPNIRSWNSHMKYDFVDGIHFHFYVDHCLPRSWDWMSFVRIKYSGKESTCAIDLPDADFTFVSREI